MVKAEDLNIRLSMNFLTQPTCSFQNCFWKQSSPLTTFWSFLLGLWEVKTQYLLLVGMTKFQLVLEKPYEHLSILSNI